MTEEHRTKIQESNRKRYGTMSEQEKKEWQAKRLAGRLRTFELIKELRKLRSKDAE